MKIVNNVKGTIELMLKSRIAPFSPVKDLKGDVIIITGASKGLGKATAETLYEEGAKLVLVSRNKKDLSKVLDIINRHYKMELETIPPV